MGTPEGSPSCPGTESSLLYSQGPDRHHNDNQALHVPGTPQEMCPKPPIPTTS
ncbi:hypothetical protein P7K49_012325, partial [Saguinus oedipus]